jgi:mannosyltransferase OCH1-like enzyme
MFSSLIYKTNHIEELRTKIDNGLLLKSQLETKYPLKEDYNTVIPLNIFQTWHTKNLPILMKNSVEYIKKLNPAFSYYLYDDTDCYNFIKDNFEPAVLYAFNSLIPGAYKADLWRYCILYKLGGIYLDIKYRPVNGFKFINLCEKEHWVLDIDGNGIYNALMVCRPKNPILLKAIYQIVKNVRTKYYGESCLHPTGPLLLANYFNEKEKNNFDMRHSYYENHNNRFIYLNNYIVFKSYNGYLQEHSKHQKVDHYTVLWKRRNIYK